MRKKIKEAYIYILSRSKTFLFRTHTLTWSWENKDGNKERQKSFYLELTLLVEVEEIKMVIKNKYDSIIQRWKKIIASYSYKSQKLKGFEKENMTHVGYVIDSKMRFIRDW